jgi:hypothetical protein
LDVGDVSLAGLEGQVGIERKSPGDLAACLTWGRSRFEAELARSRSLQFFRVVIECDLSAFLAGKYGKHESRANPDSLFESMNAFSIRYDTAFLFASSPAIAARLAESLLCKWLYERRKWLTEAEKACKEIMNGRGNLHRELARNKPTPF